MLPVKSLRSIELNKVGVGRELHVKSIMLLVTRKDNAEQRKIITNTEDLAYVLASSTPYRNEESKEIHHH